MAAGLLASKGALHHFAGRCRVCVFHTRGTCKNGRECAYCHEVHVKSSRPDRKTREQLRLYTARMHLEEADAALRAGLQRSNVEPAEIDELLRQVLDRNRAVEACEEVIAVRPR